MNKGLIKKYWSYSHKRLVVSIIIAALFSYYLGPAFILFFFLSVAGDYYSFDAKLAQINKLKAKGLTEEDAVNIQFVKKWEETRAEGKLNYCLFDGGVVQGGIFALFLCLLAMKLIGMQVLFAEVSGMFLLIGGAYLSGGVIASIIYIFLWKRNEKRFKELTQFGHLIS